MVRVEKWPLFGWEVGPGFQNWTFIFVHFQKSRLTFSKKVGPSITSMIFLSIYLFIYDEKRVLYEYYPGIIHLQNFACSAIVAYSTTVTTLALFRLLLFICPIHAFFPT